MRKRILYLLLAVAACVPAVCLLFPTVMWVGNTNLTVEFAVTDAETGKPIEGADLAITSYGGFNEDGSRLRKTERQEEELTLKTDVSGSAEYVCRDSMCFGTRSPLRFTDTFCVHLPQWRVAAKATGYEATEPFWVDVPPYLSAVKKTGNGQSKVVVPIALHKAP